MTRLRPSRGVVVTSMVPAKKRRCTCGSDGCDDRDDSDGDDVTTYSTFWACSRKRSISAFSSTTRWAVAASWHLLAVVLASRRNS
jgi:hypothetical protein